VKGFFYKTGRVRSNLDSGVVLIDLSDATRQSLMHSGSTIMAQGAEAIIYRDASGGALVIKERIRKSYRAKELDERLRSARTGMEAGLLVRARRAGVNVPRVIDVDRAEKRITLEELKGPLVREVLLAAARDDDQSGISDVCRDAGEQLGKLHRAGIVHGDLTTSNMILLDGKIFLIDFGLASPARGVEEKAVDLHLLEEALTSVLHSIAGDCFAKIMNAYTETVGASAGREVLARLEQIRRRGRYHAREEDQK